MRRLIASALLCAAAANADAGALLDLSVRDLDTGAILPTYAAGSREYVAGVPGHRYAVTLRNNTGARVLAVLSVDGVNAVSGQTADPGQAGYVLDPWEQTEVRGWRKSLSESAEFVFTSVPDSYAARTGRPQNVGVIGVAVFREAVSYPRYHEDEIARESRSPDAAGNAQPAPPAASAPGESQAGARDALAKSEASPRARRQDLGTGHGTRRYDPVGTTTFQRASSRADELVSLYYDGYDALAARGVIPRPCCRGDEPQPFPTGFVPDPPRYR
jgi:hypothetical protein